MNNGIRGGGVGGFHIVDTRRAKVREFLYNATIAWMGAALTLSLSLSLRPRKPVAQVLVRNPW